jgi:hypothetical protein
MESWAEREVIRANRNLLTVNGLILAALLLVAGAQYRYLFNFFAGPAKIESSELATFTSPGQRTRNFVTVTGSRAARTGYRDIEQRVEKATGRVVSTSVKDEYVLLKAGDRVLLVKAPPGEEKLEYSGELVATAAAVQRDLVEPLAQHEPAFAAKVLPFTLNAADYRNQGIANLVIVLPLLLLTGWNCLKGIRRSGGVKSSPTWRSMAVYGPVEQISSHIEQEIAGAQQYGRVQLTNSWLIVRSRFKTRACPLDQLAWVYKKVTKHSVNFIPTGKTYSVIICNRRREQITEQMKDTRVDEFMQALLQRAPWPIYGFNQTLAGMWRRSPAEFLAMVDARRQKASLATSG